MVHKGAFRIRIRENVDQCGLDRLRTALGLRACGRLSDDWDAEFGSRTLADTGVGSTWLTLSRTDEQRWYLRVSYPEDRPPASADVADWRREVTDGIHQAGLTPEPDA
ncbi:hypothetical protein [Nocardia mexicana]|uniref:Uncharacterized protein n=1 Tax=Nocardia mexicana TaxID=279262 RepID=A0A370GNR7_9NOCA|nr:hypothetical protein [Nocardia mexicana]RDI43583.1 hypothetical protein DFR68_12050 [Nocardia mexicana]